MESKLHYAGAVPLGQLLGTDDPIWNLIGAGESGRTDIAEDHDTHLAEGELARRDSDLVE